MIEKKILVCIPTYNEIDNVENILLAIFKIGYIGDVLFIDDNSTDGTSEKLKELVQSHKNVYCINRPSKLGIGSAHKDGIKWAYDNNYEKLITMDCDFSHLPKYINDLIACSNNADLVIGSRFNKKDSLINWNIYRRTITYIGHWLYKIILKLDYDATGAYRLYNIRNIPSGIFYLINSSGYSFFFESLYIMKINNVIIKEVDIVLPARTYGHSKMSYVNIYKSLFNLFYLFLKTKLNKESLYNLKFDNENTFEVSDRMYTISSNNSPAKIKSEWDKYWKVNTNRSNIFYELIAAFYRKFIIKRSLNYYIRKHFNAKSKLLHAGCGSGQVDVNITNEMKVTGLDISEYALKIYKKVNPNSEKQVQGDIFSMPFGDKYFNGIYNLGVMEHFTKSEINLILNEFYRVTKDDGVIVLFWPPEYGLSVIILKVVHFLMRNIFNNHKTLHPDEITRIKSKKHVIKLLGNSNLNVLKVHFGIRDFFTYNVVICNKILTKK